ncbi:hypothetical protein ACRALDRAFT_2045481 [Sodiomyces alcalophilus JCM 7366]|uniref:uncharacterized protein n=1 Tax=Sodiomyces alcalophilus JCM 7366 TaxID=591952 RepID=UPI0039B379C2
MTRLMPQHIRTMPHPESSQLHNRHCTGRSVLVGFHRGPSAQGRRPAFSGMMRSQDVGSAPTPDRPNSPPHLHRTCIRRSSATVPNSTCPLISSIWALSPGPPRVGNRGLADATQAMDFQQKRCALSSPLLSSPFLPFFSPTPRPSLHPLLSCSSHSFCPCDKSILSFPCTNQCFCFLSLDDQRRYSRSLLSTPFNFDIHFTSTTQTVSAASLSAVYHKPPTRLPDVSVPYRTYTPRKRPQHSLSRFRTPNMKSFIAAAGLLATANAYQPGSFLSRPDDAVPSASAISPASDISSAAPILSVPVDVSSLSEFAIPSASADIPVSDFPIPSASADISVSDFPIPSASVDISVSDFPIPSASAGISVSDFPISSAILESSVPAGFTTLTVDVTEIATVTSCAPTITDCAAASPTLADEDLQTFIVTQTVRLTETVCAITEVESISESVIREHETGTLTGSIITSEAPSAVPSQSESSVPPQTTSGAIPGVGEGDDEDDEYDEDECPADEDDDDFEDDDDDFEDGDDDLEDGDNDAPTVTTIPDAEITGAVPDEDEPTTTTTATTTNTMTVTVQPPESPKPTPGDGSSDGSDGSDDTDGGSNSPGNGSDDNGQCVCPTAVTVTVPASTVYVTIGSPTQSDASPVQPGTPTPAPGDDEDDNEDEFESVEDDDEVIEDGDEDVEDDEDEDEEAEDECPAEDEDEEDEDDEDDAEDECPIEDDEDEDEDEDDEDEGDFEDECPVEDDEDDEEDGDDEGDFEDECPAEDDEDEDDIEDEEDVVVVDQTVTVEPIPYPTGSALPSSGFAQPTGVPFVRRSRFRNLVKRISLLLSHSQQGVHMFVQQTPFVAVYRVCAVFDMLELLDRMPSS